MNTHTAKPDPTTQGFGRGSSSVPLGLGIRAAGAGSGFATIVANRPRLPLIAQTLYLLGHAASWCGQQMAFAPEPFPSYNCLHLSPLQTATGSRSNGSIFHLSRKRSASWSQRYQKAMDQFRSWSPSPSQVAYWSIDLADKNINIYQAYA